MDWYHGIATLLASAIAFWYGYRYRAIVDRLQSSEETQPHRQGETTGG